MSDVTLSANEIEMLVLKAARGGGVDLGYADDLARAVRFLDIQTLKGCPCSGKAVAAYTIPEALDRLHIGPQHVDAERCVVLAYIAEFTAQTGREVSVVEDRGGFHLSMEDEEEAPPRPLGRRAVPQALYDHLTELAAQTLVPESEASRAAGAGAGLTDND